LSNESTIRIYNDCCPSNVVNDGNDNAFSQSALADKNGRPNDNALEGPASENADKRDEMFHDRFPEPGEEGEEDDDCNGNNSCNSNDYGQRTAHENSSLNDKGVE
jgi:hypothetical protein